jgi:hypothetical protein
MARFPSFRFGLQAFDTSRKGRHCKSFHTLLESLKFLRGDGRSGFDSRVGRFFFWPNWRNGSAPAYGAGGCGFDPHVGLVGSRSSVGRSSASHAEGPGFDPLRELVISRKVERSIRPENSSLYSFVRYGVVGNMSGSHPVASGSIPGIG